MNEIIIEQIYRHQQKNIAEAEIVRLSARYQRVLIMRLQDKSYRQIAKTLGISAGAARMRFLRAKEQLKRLVNG